MPVPTIEPITTDVAGGIACIPHQLGCVPEPSTLVVCALSGGRHIETLTLPLVDALLVGAPDVVADAVRGAGATGAVVVAYHEATLDTVAHVATHMALGLDRRGIDVIGVAQVGLVIDGGRRMTGWVEDDDIPVVGRLSELAGRPALAALIAQEQVAAR